MASSLRRFWWTHGTFGLRSESIACSLAALPEQEVMNGVNNLWFLEDGNDGAKCCSRCRPLHRIKNTAVPPSPRDTLCDMGRSLFNLRAVI